MCIISWWVEHLSFIVKMLIVNIQNNIYKARSSSSMHVNYYSILNYSHSTRNECVRYSPTRRNLWVPRIVPFHDTCWISIYYPSPEYGSPFPIHTLQHPSPLRPPQTRIPSLTETLATFDASHNGPCSGRDWSWRRGYILRWWVACQYQHRDPDRSQDEKLGSETTLWSL